MITKEQLKAITSEISSAMNRIGKANPRKYERQFLYGDVIDWIRDNHPELRNDDHDDDFAARCSTLHHWHIRHTKLHSLASFNNSNLVSPNKRSIFARSKGVE